MRLSQEVKQTKEKLEQLVHRGKEAGRKTVVGEATLTAGEAIFTSVGAGVIAASYWKLTGNKRIYGCVAGLVIIVIGECLF